MAETERHIAHAGEGVAGVVEDAAVDDQLPLGPDLLAFHGHRALRLDPRAPRRRAKHAPSTILRQLALELAKAMPIIP